MEHKTKTMIQLKTILENFRTGEISKDQAIKEILKNKRKVLFKLINFALYLKPIAIILNFIFTLLVTYIAAWFFWLIVFKITLS